MFMVVMVAMLVVLMDGGAGGDVDGGDDGDVDGGGGGDVDGGDDENAEDHEG